MSPALIAAALLVCAADKDEAKYQFKLKKGEDAIEVRKEEKRTVFVMTSKSGIGDATVTLAEGQWPGVVVLRFQYGKDRGFKYLESFHLSTNRLQVSGSKGQSGNMELYFLSLAGKPAELAGKLNVKVEARGGALEVTLPAHLLTGAKEVSLSWIDAFRR